MASNVAAEGKQLKTNSGPEGHHAYPMSGCPREQPHWGWLQMNMPPKEAAAAAGADTAKIAEAKWRRAKTVDDVRAKHKGQPSRRR